jgi:SNF2 family DNA or RNA helicase
MHFPDQLKEYKKKAEEALQVGSIKEIEFTKNAYQVLVFDGEVEQDYWVFLKFDEENHLKESICQCAEEIDDQVGCWHCAAAYLFVYGQYKKPMHQRFNESLWNICCEQLFSQYGNNSSCLNKLSDNKWNCLSVTGKQAFIIEATTKKSLQSLDKVFFNRSKATEETSFVLSQFSHEEIIKWRQGRSTPLLSYQLSFWYDLAKLLFLDKEGGLFREISFQYSPEGLPYLIQADFESYKIEFYISRANLPHIIPSLSDLNSALKVFHKDISKELKVVYDKTKGRMSITEAPEKGDKPLKKGIVLEGWRFIPKEGFYSEVPHEITKYPLVEEKALSDVLSEYGSLLAPFIPNLIIQSVPTQLSYELVFDGHWNLHISAYLFQPGDLSKGDSRIIKNWAYLDNLGFYQLVEVRFRQIKTLILKEDVPDFITQNKSWLNYQKGFSVHIQSIEYQIGYKMDVHLSLKFFRNLEKRPHHEGLQDFGAWVYLKGQGFFSKTINTTGFLLKPGLSVTKDHIPLFVKMNRDELSLIPDFFIASNPISERGLELSITKDKWVALSPLYRMTPNYKDKQVHVLEDVVYVYEEGFYILPPSFKIPEEYQREIIIKNDEWDDFFLNHWKNIEPFIKKIDTRLIRPKKLGLKIESIQMAPESGRGWYYFGFFYASELGEFSFEVLQKAIKKKQRFVFTEGGLIDLSEKRFDWLRTLKKEQLKSKKGRVLLTLLEFMRLNAFDPIEWVPKGDEKERALFNEIMQFEPPQKPDIKGLCCSLRNYQEIGIQWLWFLYHQKLSGLLCDEMGLGKTHQAMALIASIRNFYSEVAEGVKCKFIIVCPTSVIHHWEDKIKQFLPGISICSFHGTKRSLEDFKERYDVLLTSYGTLRNEKKALSAIHFELAIFDEIQLAKNASSSIYSSLRALDSHMKLGLTGTPIENRLRELKSLFDIVLPSYMPGESEYRDYFIRPIERDNLQERKDMLNRLIKPFVLRRKKMDVLTELPEKIEEVAYCDLSTYQLELYNEVLERQRQRLIQDLENESAPVPYLHIFSLLSSLKQICDHPAVYLKTPQDYRLYESGKWDLFLELLSEARESGQKVVVFSQYLHMIDIILDELDSQQVGFATIRGSTRNRKEQIHKFNNDPKCEVFVGSLHAAGLGVDLTAGSNVIHIDRWWNKAREDQATDRVHRIGQTRGVQVFKLVTQGTFEERIDAMIAKKGLLMEEVVGADDQTVLKTFSREELFQLLKFLEKPEKFS